MSLLPSPYLTQSMGINIALYHVFILCKLSFTYDTAVYFHTGKKIVSLHFLVIKVCLLVTFQMWN